MKQSREIPEIYWELKKHFKINWGKGVIITYGDIVYCKRCLECKEGCGVVYVWH